MENVGLFGGLFYMAFAILMIISYWKIFEKAGKPGWACLIPFYNIIVILEIIGKPWYWLLFMLVPLLNVIFGIWALNLLMLSYGKNSGWTVGTIILPFIFIPLLGLGDAKYEGPAGQ